MPTLLEPNKIIVQPWYKLSEKKQITTDSAIDFILQQIEDRIVIKNNPPKIKITGLGSKVLVIRSKTGSGKSTIMPTAIYNKFNEQFHANVLITQPTRITAMEIPYDIVKWNKNITFGNNIGYQTGVSSRKAGNGILFCTIGILLQFLKTLTDEQFCKKYAFIIIDEVHNRSLELDMTLFYLKQLLSRVWDEKNCPFVILTSGTFDPKIFMNYFECPKENFIDVLGFSYPITDHYTKFDVSNYIEYAVDLVERIHMLDDPLYTVDKLNDKSNDKTNDKINDKSKHTYSYDKTNTLHDILIFVQGSAQIKTIIDKIHYLNYIMYSGGLKKSIEHAKDQQKKYGGKEESLPYLMPIALMSENIAKGSEEYINIFSPIETIMAKVYKFNKDVREEKVLEEVPVVRRVLIGTNAVETGITISSLGHVIDTGFLKEVQFNSTFGCSVLMDRNITQANSMQRRGRVGRNAPGSFYACYTKESFDAMDPLPFPDIIRDNITIFLLNSIIKMTATNLIEIDHTDRDVDSFQKNQFDQNWYKLEYENAFDVEQLDMPQPPSAESLSYAIEFLHGLGFITHEYLPSIFAFYAIKFRKVRLENIRLILAGYHHDANILDLITIVCFIQQKTDLGIKKHKYQIRNPLNVSDKQAEYYYKYIIQDEFIEYLFIWNEFIELFEKPGLSLISDKLDKWCEEIGVRLDSMLRIVELRDEIISDMITMGLNPYYNGLNLERGVYNFTDILKRNLTEGVDEIKKIKNCIYEGYRFQIYIWNDISRQYVGRFQNNVELTSYLIDHKSGQVPQKIIVSDVVIRELPTKLYKFIGGDISVLDGFVDVDMEFLNH